MDTWEDLVGVLGKETGNDGNIEPQVNRATGHRVSFQNQRNHITGILKPR